MLVDVVRQLDRIVSRRVVIPLYDVIDVIAFPYRTHYLIHGILLRRISDILLFLSRVPCVHFSKFCISLVALESCCPQLAFPSPLELL